VADAGEPGGEEGPGRRAECEAHPETKRREQGVVGLCEKEGRKGKKSERWAAAPFLYPAKAAAGPCTRLAGCGDRGFPMRTCRSLVYTFFIIAKYIVFVIIVKTVINTLYYKDLYLVIIKKAILSVNKRL
jgi:hypothetical protein